MKMSLSHWIFHLEKGLLRCFIQLQLVRFSSSPLVDKLSEKIKKTIPLWSLRWRLFESLIAKTFGARAILSAGMKTDVILSYINLISIPIAVNKYWAIFNIELCNYVNVVRQKKDRFYITSGTSTYCLSLMLKEVCFNCSHLFNFYISASELLLMFGLSLLSERKAVHSV